MSKKARIAELERKLLAANKALAAEMQRTQAQMDTIDRLRAERRPSLRDAAKREWQQLTERVLQAVGL